MKLELHPDAQEDLQEAVRWYGDRDLDIARTFVESVDSVLRGVATDPLRWPLHSRLKARRVTLGRFPYSIFYELVNGKLIRVLAIARHKRHPDYWNKRRDGGH